MSQIHIPEDYELQDNNIQHQMVIIAKVLKGLFVVFRIIRIAAWSVRPINEEVSVLWCANR